MALRSETMGRTGAGIQMLRGLSALRQMSTGKVMLGVVIPCGVQQPVEITSLQAVCWKQGQMLTRATAKVFRRCLRQCGEDNGMLLNCSSSMAHMKLLGSGQLGRAKNGPVVEPRDMTGLSQL